MMCIYKIANTITNEIYVGSALNFAKRKYYHLYDLKNNKHHSIILQNSYNKHGEQNFIFSIIEEVFEKEDLIKREQYYIDELNPKYNCCRIAGSPLGVKHTLQSRLNMSKAHLGKKLTPESIAKRTIKQSGKNHYGYGKARPDDVRKKLSIPVEQYSKDGIFIKEWFGITEAEKKLDICHISSCCKGNRKTAGGFIWKYKEEK